MRQRTKKGSQGSGIASVRIATVVATVVIILSLLVLSIFGGTVAAHGDEADEQDAVAEGMAESKPVAVLLDEAIRQNTMRAVIAGTALLLLLVFASVAAKNAKRKKRKTNPLLLHLLLWSIVVVVVSVTAYVAGSTIYLNAVSETAGPVHWHADFEVWNCGERLELADPEGFSNRVGNPVLHEHGDNRMHIEGVVVDYGDVSIGSFFRSVGGDLHKGILRLPTNEGIATIKDGDSCAGGPGTLQVFVLMAVNGKIAQQKLDSSNYEDYVPSPYGNIPPGDCLVFEFAAEVKDKTVRLCESYEAALKTGHVEAGHGAAGDADGG